MSITITGNQTTFDLSWDEITLIIVSCAFCISWVLSTYFKYRNK